jgi:hypothetical protein
MTRDSIFKNIYSICYVSHFILIPMHFWFNYVFYFLCEGIQVVVCLINEVI